MKPKYGSVPVSELDETRRLPNGKWPKGEGPGSGTWGDPESHREFGKLGRGVKKTGRTHMMEVNLETVGRTHLVGAAAAAFSKKHELLPHAEGSINGNISGWYVVPGNLAGDGRIRITVDAGDWPAGSLRWSRHEPGHVEIKPWDLLTSSQQKCILHLIHLKLLEAADKVTQETKVGEK